MAKNVHNAPSWARTQWTRHCGFICPHTSKVTDNDLFFHSSAGPCPLLRPPTTKHDTDGKHSHASQSHRPRIQLRSQTTHNRKLTTRGHEQSRQQHTQTAKPCLPPAFLGAAQSALGGSEALSENEQDSEENEPPRMPAPEPKRLSEEHSAEGHLNRH